MKKQSYFKKFAAVAMAAVMTFAFTACGSDDAGTENGGADANAKFVIGGIGPTTGGAAVYGQAVKNAAEMASMLPAASTAIRLNSFGRMMNTTPKRLSTRITP